MTHQQIEQRKAQRDHLETYVMFKDRVEILDALVAWMDSAERDNEPVTPTRILEFIYSKSENL